MSLTPDEILILLTGREPEAHPESFRSIARRLGVDPRAVNAMYQYSLHKLSKSRDMQRLRREFQRERGPGRTIGTNWEHAYWDMD